MEYQDSGTVGITRFYGNPVTTLGAFSWELMRGIWKTGHLGTLAYIFLGIIMN